MTLVTIQNRIKTKKASVKRKMIHEQIVKERKQPASHYINPQVLRQFQEYHFGGKWYEDLRKYNGN